MLLLSPEYEQIDIFHIFMENLSQIKFWKCALWLLCLIFKYLYWI